jgi:sugar diacid utilization regulator
MTPLGHHWLFSATALVDDVPFAHLAVRLHQKPRPGTYAGSVVRFAIRILQMIGIAGRARVEQEGALRVAVLRDLLEVAVPDRALLERLRVLGFQPDACVRIVLADRAAEIPARSAANELAGAFARHGTRAIVDPGEHEALVLVERDSDERATLAALAAGAQRQLVNAGVGLAVTLREGVQQTQREAMVARLRARREGAEVVWFDDVGLADQLLSWPQAYRLSSAGELLAPLVERPDLLHTLTVYLEHDCSVPATASALFLHTNSIRYRLSTIERLLGRSLSSIDTVLDLTLAMRIKAVAHEGSQSAQAPGAR